MKRFTLRYIAALFHFSFFVCFTSFGQDSTDTLLDTSFESAITLNAFVQETQVPQNRLGQLVIRLQWTGDLDRYEVHPFENPILQNFEIQGSGSANRVATVNGLATAIREYTFTLKPEAIGMGYIEPMIIKYTDRSTDVEHRLTTNRIQVQVVDPVREAGSPRWLVWSLLILVLGAGVLFFVRHYVVKKAARKKSAQEINEVAVPIEEKYLQELKEKVKLNEPTLDGAGAFSHMSKMLRRFLHERFDAPGLQATTSQVSQFLYDQKFDDRIVNEIKEILSNADIIKFSGKPVDRPDVERAFTIVESIFQKSIRNEIDPNKNESTTIRA